MILNDNETVAWKKEKKKLEIWYVVHENNRIK